MLSPSSSIRVKRRGTNMTDIYTIAQNISLGIAGAAGISAIALRVRKELADAREATAAREMQKKMRDTLIASRIDPMSEENVQAFDNSLYFHAYRFGATAIRVSKPFRDCEGFYEIAVMGKDRNFPNSPYESQVFARFSTQQSPLGDFEVEQTFFAPYARFIGLLDGRTEQIAQTQTLEIVKQYATRASKETTLPLEDLTRTNYNLSK